MMELLHHLFSIVVLYALSLESNPVIAQIVFHG